MRVLITRAEPAAKRSVSNLKSAGYSPVFLPLFEVEDLQTELPEEQFDGFVLTSANALEVLKSRGWRNNNPAAIAFCVGKTTAEMAQNAGFSNIVMANGGGEKLAEKMRSDFDLAATKLLFPTTPDRSFDMADALSSVDIKEVHIYKVRRLKPGAKGVSEALNACKNGAALSYSARSASHLDALVSELALTDLSRELHHVTISKQASNKLNKGNWKDIAFSDLPNESSMIEQLNRIAKSC